MTVATTPDIEPSAAAASAGRPVYLDANATTPVDQRVGAEVVRFLLDEFGNAGSRTHGYGQQAKERVNLARSEVASVVAAKPDEVVFTSGATEANNLALLGLAPHGDSSGRRHIVSTQVEHKAVLEPLDSLRDHGFEISLVSPTPGGWVDPDELIRAVRADTLAVSMMAVNNETGVVQPVDEVARLLAGHEAYFHVDAAQAFGKLIEPLREQRIDLISVSGHKIFGPKGIGALICRRRGYERPPLQPLFFGGGQERGLRPGTLPVHLIAGLGTAAALAGSEHGARAAACSAFRDQALAALAPLDPTINGDLERCLPSTLNISIPGVDSEAAIVALKDLVAISNGSACTSQDYTLSHVLLAMGLTEERVRGALRLSWMHETPVPPWDAIVARLLDIRIR